MITILNPPRKKNTLKQQNNKQKPRGLTFKWQKKHSDFSIITKESKTNGQI